MNQMKNKIRLGLFLLLFSSQIIEGQGVGNFFQPNLLLGGAGVASEADLDTIMINPAQLGDLNYSGAQFAWAIHNQEYQQRYPGFPAHSSSDSGLEDFPTPSFAYKFNRKFGVTGFTIPFPVEVEIDKRGLPLIVLNQQNTVDLIGKGRSEGLFLGGLGYAFTPNFSIGSPSVANIRTSAFYKHKQTPRHRPDLKQNWLA